MHASNDKEAAAVPQVGDDRQLASYVLARAAIMISSASSQAASTLGNNAGPKNGGSRESSEFEFVDGQAKATSAMPAPPAPLPPSATLSTQNIAAAATIEASPALAPGQTSPSATDKPAEKGTITGASAAKMPTEVSQKDGEEELVGLIGWMRGASAPGGIFSRVAEKTKTSMETVITTLDPQMKEYIHSGGDINVIVGAEGDDDVLVVSVRSAFQATFGRATVDGGQERQASAAKTVAEQPVGFAAARQAAVEKIQSLRANHADQTAAVLSAKDFLLEVGDDQWVEMTCIALKDAAK